MRVDSRRYFVMVRSLMTMLSMFILLAFMHGISSSFTPLPPRWNAFPSRLIPQFNSDGLVLLPADSILTPNVLFNCHNEATKACKETQETIRKAKGERPKQSTRIFFVRFKHRKSHTEEYATVFYDCYDEKMDYCLEKAKSHLSS